MPVKHCKIKATQIKFQTVLGLSYSILVKAKQLFSEIEIHCLWKKCIIYMSTRVLFAYSVYVFYDGSMAINFGDILHDLYKMVQSI